MMLTIVLVTVYYCRQSAFDAVFCILPIISDVEGDPISCASSVRFVAYFPQKISRNAPYQHTSSETSLNKKNYELLCIVQYAEYRSKRRQLRPDRNCCARTETVAHGSPMFRSLEYLDLSYNALSEIPDGAKIHSLQEQL